MKSINENDNDNLFKYSSFKFEIINNNQNENLNRVDKSKRNNFISQYPLNIIHSQKLNKKEETYLDEKMMICHFFPCMKKFKSRENLDLHILNIHLKIKPFQCKFCERKFSHRNGKIYHERTKHLNYLPFPCTNCLKKFASKTALKVHSKSKHILSMCLDLF